MSTITSHSIYEPGHFICADACGWFKHDHAGDYCVSSIGEWDRTGNGEFHPLGGWDQGFYETFLFDADGNEITGERFETREECLKHHNELCSRIYRDLNEQHRMKRENSWNPREGYEKMRVRRDEVQIGDILMSSHGYDLLICTVRTSKHPQGTTELVGYLHCNEGGPTRNEIYDRGSQVLIARKVETADTHRFTIRHPKTDDQLLLIDCDKETAATLATWAVRDGHSFRIQVLEDM